MEINSPSTTNTLLSQLLPFLISLLDDALVLGLSRLGLHIQWLKWLSPVILCFSIVYFALQLLPHCYRAWKSLGVEK